MSSTEIQGALQEIAGAVGDLDAQGAAAYIAAAVAAAEGGGSVDLSAYEGESIGLTATDPEGDGIILTSNGFGGVEIVAEVGQVNILNSADGESLNLTANGTGGTISLTADSGVTVAVDGAGMLTNLISTASSDAAGGVTLKADGALGAAVTVLVNLATAFSAIHDGSNVLLGFYGAAEVPRPEVPASPNAQDVVDALVALGLVTQAAP